MTHPNPSLQYEPVHMGQIIRRIYLQRKLNLSEFSRGIGLSLTYTSRLFSKRTISLARLRIISQYFGEDLCIHLTSAAHRELLLRGGPVPGLEAALEAAATEAAELRAQLAAAAAEAEGLRSEIDGLRAELARVEAEREQEVSARLEAEIQIRILEGKLEMVG